MSQSTIVMHTINRITFQQATCHDIEDVVEINNSHLYSYSQHGFLITKFSTQEVKHVLKEHPGSIILARNLQEEVVGFVQVSDSSDITILQQVNWIAPDLQDIFENNQTLYIEKVAVKQNFQHQSIGSALYDELFRRFTDVVFYAFVVVKPIINTASINFHLKHGFSKSAVFHAAEFCGLKDYESFLLMKGMQVSK